MSGQEPHLPAIALSAGMPNLYPMATFHSKERLKQRTIKQAEKEKKTIP